MDIDELEVSVFISMYLRYSACVSKLDRGSQGLAKKLLVRQNLDSEQTQIGYGYYSLWNTPINPTNLL